MDLLIEFILELFLESSIEISSNKKINKWIRYPLALSIIVFYLYIISLFVVIGINIYKENLMTIVKT